MAVETIRARNWRIVGNKATPQSGARLWDLAKAVTGNGLDWEKLKYKGRAEALPIGRPIDITPLLELRGRGARGRRAGRLPSAGLLDARRRTAMRHIKQWFFNLRYADEFARLICELSDPEDEVESREAERIRSEWYDYTTKQARWVKNRTEPFAWGVGLVSAVKIAERQPTELVEGLHLWQAGAGRAALTPKLLRAGRITGHTLTVFGMGLDGYLFWGNVRDRKYAEAVGNVGNIVGGGAMLYEAAVAPKLLAAGNAALAGKMAFGMSVCWPIAAAVGVGIFGSWVIGMVGKSVVQSRIREGKRRVLPSLRKAYSKHKERVEQAKHALEHMASRAR